MPTNRRLLWPDGRAAAMIVVLATAGAATGCENPVAVTKIPVETAEIAGVVVDDTGAGVVSAQVSAFVPNPPKEYQATTDGSGHFLLSFPHVTQMDVATTAPGYDLDDRFVPTPTTLSTTAILLHRTVGITAGQSLTINVLPTDRLCNSEVDGAWLGFACRIVHVQVPGAGVLNVVATPLDSAGAPRLEYQDDPENVLGVTTSGRATFPVPVGEDIQIWVAIPTTSASARSFTIATSLGP